MVPDGFKMGIAVDLGACNDNALGVVCDGVQTTAFDRESMDMLQLTCLDCFFGIYQFGLHMSPCRDFVHDDVRQP